MKKFTKIFSLILIIMGSVIGFNACGGDPYKDLKVTLSETSLSLAYDTENDENNIFELTATVSGGDDDISRGVIFSSSNENIVSLIEGSQVTDGDKTTAKFILVNGGNATITARSTEKASVHAKCEVAVEVGVSKIEFYGNTLATPVALPIELGVKTDVIGKFGTNVAGRIKFTPDETNQRNVILKAYTLEGVLLEQDAVKIEGNYITVLSEALNEFTLYAESVANSALHDEIIVKVLKPITNDVVRAMSIGADDPASVSAELKSSIVGGIKTFDLNLANNVVMGSFEDRKNLVFNIEDMDITEIENLYSFTLQTTKPRSFNVRGVEGTSNVFLFEQGDGNTSEEISIFVNYKGYEKYFQNKEIKVRVNVSAFADKVLITKPNESDAKESFDVYKNYSNNANDYALYGVDYKGLALNVKAQSDNKTLHGQKVRLVVRDLTANEYVTDGSFIILNESGLDVSPISVDISGEPVFNNLIYSGENVYVRYDYNKLSARGIDHNYVLIAISDLYAKATSYGEDINAQNRLNIINQDVYASITSEIAINLNGEYLLTRDGLSQVGDIDKVVMRSENPGLVSVKYDETQQGWVLTNTNGKLGSTKVWVATPNGYTAYSNVVVWQETNIENLKLKFGNKIYDATTEEQDPTKLYLICGSVLNVSYIIDGVEYPTSTGGMKLTASEYEKDLVSVSLDCSQVSISRIGGETPLTFTFINLHNDETLYFKFEIDITKPISEFYLDPTAENKLNIIPSNATNVAELEDQKTGYFTLIPNPNDATINPHSVDWGITYGNKSYSPRVLEEIHLVEGSSDVWTGKLYFVLIETKFAVTVTYTINETSRKVSVEYTATKDASEKNNAFSLFIAYAQTYYNLDGTSYSLNIGNYGVQITVEDIVTATSITPSMNIVTFNKYQLTSTNEGYIVGVEDSNKHIQTITYSILPNKNMTYPGIVTLDVNKNPMKYDETKKVYFTGANVYEALYHLSIDEKFQRVTITLNYGYSSLDDFDFFIATKDSIQPNGTYNIFTKIEVVIAQGTTKNPYKVSDAVDLQFMNYDLAGCYELQNNIYLNDFEFTPIGTIEKPFVGRLNGKGMFITGLDATYDVKQNENEIATYGLFGYIAQSIVTEENGGSVINYSVANLTIKNFNLVADYTNADTPKDVYIGALAGYLGGSVENIVILDNDTTNYSKIDSTLVNGIHKGGVTYIGSSNNSLHNVFVGGLAGVVASPVTKIKVNTFIDFADEDDDEEGKGSHTYVGGITGAVVSGSIVNSATTLTDVNVVINNTTSYFTKKTYVGGVVGANQGTISNIKARTVVLANNNVGGFAGINTGTIQNSTVQPTVYGKENVGGFAAVNAWGKQSELSEHVYFNKKATSNETNNHIECITSGTGNFSGTIISSKVIMLDQLDRISMFNTSVYGENNVGGFVGLNYYSDIYSTLDSAKDASMSDLVANISYSSVKTYFGVNKDSAFATRRSISTNYAKDNIEGLYYGDVVVNGGVAGGFIGRAKDLSLINNYSHVNITSLNSESIIGGVAGVVSGYLFVNATPVLGDVNGEATLVGGFIGDASGVATIEHAHDFFDTSDNILKYNTEINSIDLTKGINNSYTLLTHGGEYVQNFVGAGEFYEGVLNQDIYILTIDVDEETQKATYNYFKDGVWTIEEVENTSITQDTYYLGKVKVKLPRIFVSNTFYIGYSTVNNSGTTLVFNLNNAKNPSYYPTTDALSYSNLRHYEVKFFDYSAGDSRNTTFVLNSDGISVTYTQDTELLSENPYIKNPIKNNTASYYVVDAGKVDVGLNDTLPTNQTYYLNSTVNGGFPVPFAKTPISGAKPNLVYDIAPESIEVEYIDGHFAVNEADPTDKKLTLEYDVEKPLFEGPNKNLEYKDIIGADNKIKPNVYCLTDKSVFGLNIKPEFVKNGKVVFTSSNPDIAQVIVEGENVYLAIKGIGNVSIYISSSYNLGINEVVSLQIYKKISSFELMTKSFDGNDYMAMGDSHELIRNHTTTIYPYLNGSRENLNNIGFEITSNVATSGNLFVNGQDVFGKTLRVDSSLFGLNAKQEFNGVVLTIKPYINFVIDGKTYVKYINHEKTITLNSINGTFGINGPEDFTFPVTNSEEFEIVLTTDSKREWLELNVTVGEENSSYIVFEDHGYFDVLLDEGDNLASILNFSIISTTADNGTFTYNIGVNLPRENYSYITKDTTFNISVGLKNNIHNIDPYEFDIVVIPQQVQSVVINHYTDMVYSGGANPEAGQYETYKYPSSSVIPGYTSLITLDVNPSYAQLDRVVISMSHTSADIEQLVEVRQTSNGYSLFQKYPDYDKDYLTKQIIVRNLVSTSSNTFDGKLYFGLHVDSTLNDANIVINFKGYVNGRDGNVFDKDLTLNVVAMPNVQLKFVEDGLAELPVAVGTSVDFTITASNFDAITFNTDALTNYGQLSTEGNGTYTFTFNEDYTQQHNMLYNYIEITATAKRTLAYGIYSKSSTIKMMLVPFVVRGIEINGAEDGKIKGYFNQIKELSASLVAEYGEAYNAWLESTKKDTVTYQIDKLNKQMNYAVETDELAGDVNPVYNYYTNSELVYSNLFKTSPSAEGNSLLSLKGMAYNDFVIRMLPNDDKTKTVTSIQFTKLDMHTYIVASVNIVYLKNGTTLISFGGGAGGENVIVKEVKTSVIGDIKSISDEDYPDPITSVDDFLDMNRYQSEKDPKDRGNFILLNDLVLTNWVPMPAYFNSLDGNGYTITIMSFAKMEDMTASTSGAKIGLFSTVGDSSNTYVTIKNLTVEINAGVVGETSGEVILNENHTLEINATDKNNMASHTNITFGVIAAENYGTITNTVVTNRATDLRNQRKDILKQQVELGYVEMENLQDFKKYLETFDNDEDASLDAVDVVYLNSGKNTETKGNIIGGFVGSNKGYITNSNVENVSIKGSDMVGGFVGENSGKISSSYFKGASIIDTDSNSANSNSIGLGGFVANNTTSGIIQYSYVNGIEGFDVSMPNTGLGTLDRSGFVGSKYSEKADLNFLRSMNSAIYTQTNAGGFAYKNDGLISNSYSNILVSAQSGAGFALDNDGGTIEYSYSMSSVKFQGANDVPFTKDGNVKDSYYLKVDATDLSSTDLDKMDEFSNENESLGTSLNASQFADYNSFASFAFNTDYHDNKEITSSVWFIPRDYNPFVDGEEIEGSFQGVLAKYFRNNYYTINRPELVSPNLKTLSIRYYCKDETTGSGDKDDKGYYYNLVETINYDYVEDDKTHNPVGIEVKSDGTEEKTIARGSLLNPLLINDGDSFNRVFTTTAGDDKVNKNNFRVIKDVTFDNLDQTAKTYDIVFSGNLDGNGMTIENLHIESDPSLVTSEITTFGMFSKVAGVVDGTTVVKNTGVVRALNINIEEINGATVNLVGILAGQLENAKIYNVKVDGSPEVNVQGLNAVGGIAGLATGKTEMINIESNVSVNATLTANKNLFRKYNYNAKDTTFEVYNGLDLTDENNNIKEVCYAGGVVGIFDVEKNPGLTSGNEGVKNLDRMRTVKTYGSIKIQGQVVGGITGYVGKTSAISNVYVEIDTDAHFVASRIGGGIVGHNEGKINRAGIYHSNQATIDKSLLSSSDRYENPTSDIIVTGSYPNLFGYVNQNSNLNSNAHFIGGIVGFNNGNECEDPTSERGVVTNSYSRVDVVSQDAMYAGGVIGLNIAGKLNTIYTTGSVFGVLGTGGIIGIQANYNEDKKLDIVTVNNTKEAIKKNIISNTDEICPTDVTDELVKTDLGHIIGANIWTYTHTNTIRAHYDINANASHIGMLAGYVMGANEDSRVGAYYESAGLTSRVKGEDIYFKQTFAYGNTAQILKEVGNINRGNDMEGEVFTYSNAIKQFDKIALISGYSSDGDDSYYKFSRLGDTGSLRTLKEFLNRIGSNDGENKFFTRFTGEELTGDKPDSGVINHPKIYYAWDRTEWAGTELNESNVKIEAEYAFPGHTNRVEAKVIYVYTEEDLRLMTEYSGAEFILMNDITLTRPWEPVGNLISPFRGILRSNDADGDGTLENYKISGIEIDSNEPNVGFIAISNGAKVRSIKFEFNSFKAENVNASDSSVGMLIGRALGSLRSNLIENISITCASQVEMKDYEYNGGFIGAGDRLILTNNKISGIKLQSFETKVDKNYNINFNFGWIAGNATLTNNLIQEKDAYGDPVYTEDGNPKLVEAGHVGNVVENCGLYHMSGSYEVTGHVRIDARNPHEDKVFSGSTLYVGGLFGNLVSKTATETFLDKNVYKGQGIKIEIVANNILEKEIETIDSKGRPVKEIISTQAYCNEVAVGGIIGNVRNLGIKNLSYVISTDYAVDFINGLRLNKDDPTPNGFVARRKGEKEIVANTYNFSLGGLIGYANMCDIDKIDKLNGKTVKYVNSSNYNCEVDEKTGVVSADVVVHNYNLGLLIGGFVSGSINESGLAYSDTNGSSEKHLNITFDGAGLMPETNFGVIGYSNTSEVQNLTAKNYNLYYSMPGTFTAQGAKVNGGGLFGYAYDTQVKSSATASGELMINGYADMNSCFNLGGIVGHMLGGGKYEGILSDTAVTQLANASDSVYVGGFVGKIGEHFTKVDDDDEKPQPYTYNFDRVITQNYILNENLFGKSHEKNAQLGIGGFAGGVMYYSTVNIYNSAFNSNIGYTYAMGVSSIEGEIFDIDLKDYVSTNLIQKYRLGSHSNGTSSLHEFFKNTTYKGGVIGYTGIEKKEYIYIGGEGNITIDSSTVYNGDLIPYSSDWGTPVSKDHEKIRLTNRGRVSSYKSVTVSEGISIENYGTVLDSANIYLSANYGAVLYTKVNGSVNNKETGFVFGSTIEGAVENSSELICNAVIDDNTKKPEMFGNVAETTVVSYGQTTLDGVCAYLNNVVLQYSSNPCNYTYIGDTMYFIKKLVDESYPEDDSGNITVEVFTDENCKNSLGTRIIPKTEFKYKEFKQTKYIYYLFAGNTADGYVVRTDGSENGLYIEETRLVSSFMYPKTWKLDNITLEEGAETFTYRKTSANDKLSSTTFDFNDVWMKVNGENDNRVGFMWMFKKNKFDRSVGEYNINEESLRAAIKSNTDYFKEINTPDKLLQLSYAVNNGIYTGSAALTADIDMRGYIMEPIGKHVAVLKEDGSYEDLKRPFTGGFNGNGHKIRNLTVVSSDYSALFGYVQANGQTFENVLIENSTFINTEINLFNKVVSQLINTIAVEEGIGGSITQSQIGLRYNDMFSVITDARNTTKQSAFIGTTQIEKIGGLLDPAINTKTEIIIDTSYAIMYSVDYGYGAKTLKDSVINSWSKGTTLTMKSGYVGAVEYGVKTRDKHYKENPLMNCIMDFLIDAVSMDSYSNYASTHSFEFTNVYGTGNASNGLSSSFDSSTSYKDLVQLRHDEIGEISPLTTEELCGFDWHTVWTRDPNANNGLPILTHNGLYWKDFARSTRMDLTYLSGVVTIKTPEGLAHLSNIVNGIAETNPAGNVEIGGSFYNPDVIKNAAIVINNNINLGGKFWTPIGTDKNPFFGSFDGKGYTISNLTTMGQYGDGLSYTSGYSGLFGVVARKSDDLQVFKDVKLTNITINDRRTGGLIAKMDVSNVFIPDAGSTPGGAVTPTVLSAADATEYSATITNIIIDGGQIKGIYSAGGIIGEVKGNVHITHSKNSANISEYIQNIGVYDEKENTTGYDLTKTTYLGGIAGFAGPDVEIFNVVNSGNVVSKTTDALDNFKVGGIVGHAYGANVDTTLMTGYVSVQKESINGTNSLNGIGGIVGYADYDAIIQNVKLEAYDSDGDPETKEETPTVYGVYNTGGLVGIMQNASLYEGAVFGTVNDVGSNNNAYFVGKYNGGNIINLYTLNSAENKTHLFGSIKDGEDVTIKMVSYISDTTQYFHFMFSNEAVNKDKLPEEFENSSAWVENGEKWVLNEFGRTYNPNQPLSNEKDKENLAVNYIPNTTRLESDVKKQYEVKSEDDLLALNNWYTFRYGFDYKFGIKFMNDITISTGLVVGIDGKPYTGTEEIHAKVSADTTITITYQNTRTSGLFGNVEYIDFENINIEGTIVSDLIDLGGLVNKASSCKFKKCSSNVNIDNAGKLDAVFGSTGGIVGYLRITDCGELINCSYSGNISGRNCVGGLIGEVSLSAKNNALNNVINLSNSLVHNANIKGRDKVGGLIGCCESWETAGMMHCDVCGLYYTDKTLANCPLDSRPLLFSSGIINLHVVDTNVKVEDVIIDFLGFKKDETAGWMSATRFTDSFGWEKVSAIWSNPSGMYRRDFDDENISSGQWYGPTSGSSGNGETKSSFYNPKKNEGLGKDSSVYYTTFGCNDGENPGSLTDVEYVTKFFSKAVGYSAFNGTYNVGLCYGFIPNNSTFDAEVDDDSKITTTSLTTTKDESGYIIIDRFAHWIYVAIEPEGESTYKNGLKVIEYTYKFDETQTCARKYDFIKDVMTDSKETEKYIKIHTAQSMLEDDWDDVKKLYVGKDLSSKSEITEKNKVSDLFYAGGVVNTFINQVKNL